jgi:hypothetical protein
MPRFNWDGDTIADRISLTLPARVAKKQASKVWKLLRSMAEIFKVNVDGIDELFLQTNLVTASGDFLDDYIYDLTKIKRELNESDDDYRDRFYRNVWVYNNTKNGMREITFDVMGHYPVALVDKSRGGFYDSLYYYNDLEGGSHYNGGTEPYVGYIILESRPSSAQLDELCTLINKYKALGVKIYIKYKKYDVYTGYSYEEIAQFVTEQSFVKVIGPAAYGDFYNAAGYYNDTNYPAIYGDEDESSYTYKYLYLAEAPSEGVLDELLESLSENLVGSDNLYVVYPSS